jgi:hypothetical protein
MILVSLRTKILFLYLFLGLENVLAGTESAESMKQLFGFARRNSTNNGPNLRNRYRGNKELCTEIKKYPGKSNGAFITRDPGHWRYLPDGSMTYEVSTCQLKRFTAPEARRCLASHHTLLIGDSLMRYQFLGLAYFIEHGRWPARFAMASPEKGDPPAKDCKHFDIAGNPTCSPPGSPSIVSENDWANVYGHATDKSWRYMHQYIGGEGMNGRVECQCARSEADTSTEVMFYERTFRDNAISRPSVMPSSGKRSGEESSQIKPVDKEAQDRVRLSFLSNLGDLNVHLWSRSFCERTASCNLTADAWYRLQDKANNKSWDIDADLLTVITNHLTKIIPDVDIALFNTGLWGGGGHRWVKEVMQRLFSFVHGRKFPLKDDEQPTKAGRCYWKGMSPAWSTNANGYPDSFASADNENRVAAYDAGCGVFDVRHVTKQFASFQWMGDLGRASCCGEKEMMQVYFDAAHFQPWVNEELNQILLNQLC